MLPSNNPASRSSVFRAAEKSFVVLALLFYSDAGLNLITGEARQSQGSALHAVQLTLYAILPFFMVPCWKHMLRAVQQMKLVLALVLLAGLSTVWSYAPLLTFKFGLWLLATTMFGMYFGARFRRDEQVNLVMLALGIAGLASLALAVTVPGYAQDHSFHPGDWRGIFQTKNLLGKAMSLEWVAALLVATTRKKLGLATALMSLLLVGASGSRTGLALCAILVLCYGTHFVVRWPKRTMVPALLFGVILALLGTAWVTRNTGAALAESGRDSTLSGRLGLWTFVNIAISRRPWTGYGFGAFWMDATGADIYVTQNVGWNPPHAHNGFLDLGLALGLVGVVLFACGFLQTAGRSIEIIRLDRSGYSGWPILFLAFLVFSNLSESGLLQANQIYWVLYVSIAASLSLEQQAVQGYVQMKEAW
jgi:exopolysaccharide production protein ExoQ